MRFWLGVSIAAVALASCGPSGSPGPGASDRSDPHVTAASNAIDASPATLAALNCLIWDGTIPETSESTADPYPSDSFANETDDSPNASDGGVNQTRRRAIRDVRAHSGLLRWTVSGTGEQEYFNWFIEGDPDTIAKAAVAAGGGTLRKIKDSAWSGDYQIYVRASAGAYEFGTPTSMYAWLDRPQTEVTLLTATANPTGVRFSCGNISDGDFPGDFE